MKHVIHEWQKENDDGFTFKIRSQELENVDTMNENQEYASKAKQL